MSDVLAKADLFVRLGYGSDFDLLEEALQEAGLSRPGKPNIAARKAEQVRAVLADRFVIVCSRGDCQADAHEVADGRSPVTASVQEECAVCGGSANARAVDAMVEAMRDAGLERLCVVGGSPNAHAELQRLVAKRIELRIVQGSSARTVRQAQADLTWAQRVALWGGTILDHQVSNLYKGPHVIRFARRSIQQLAREVTRSVSRAK